MFKASGDLIIRASIDENEESIIYNGDERRATKSFADADFIVKSSPNNARVRFEAILKPSGRWSGDYRTERGILPYLPRYRIEQRL